MLRYLLFLFYRLSTCHHLVFFLSDLSVGEPWKNIHYRVFRVSTCLLLVYENFSSGGPIDEKYPKKFGVTRKEHFSITNLMNT